MKQLNILALQLDLVWEDPAANRRSVEKKLSMHGDPFDMLVLPEMFCTGFTMEPAKNSETMDGATVSWMEKLAQKHKALILGSLVIKEGQKYFNRLIAMGPEGLLGEYDKRHLFRMAGEDQHYHAGEEWLLFDYKGWNICPLVCYDLRFPVWSRNRTWNSRGLSYDLLVYVANWPSKRVDQWETLLKARAIENQAFVIGLNRVGVDGNGVEYNGNSLILDPLAKVLAREVDKEALLTATLDPEVLTEWREKFPIWKDSDDFDLVV